MYALIDSERTTPTDPLSETRQLFAQACEEAEIKCRVLNRRSIENYFSDRAVKAVKGEKYQALGEYERLKDAPLAWAKAENWRIAREMTREELESTDDLGTFLESL